MEHSDFEEVKQEAMALPKESVELYVARSLTYGFNTCPISMTDKEINDATFNECLEIDKDFGNTGVPVGYVLFNGGDTIKDVAVPNYRMTDSGLYEGKVEKIDFQPYSYLKLPTKYIILLLMKLGRGLKIDNGEFEKMNSDLETDDYDAKLSNFMFRPNSEWVSYFNKLEAIEPVGYYEIKRGKNLGLRIMDDEYIKVFGNLDNLFQKGYFKKPDDSVDIAEITDSAAFLGALLNDE